MKQKHMLVGSIGLVFMMILTGCDYDGPSADEIADAVTKRSEISTYSSQIKNYLANSGKLTITKDIQAWGQTNAAYTLIVNTAERQSFNLPTDTGLTWEGNGNADIKRSDSLITLAEKSNARTATFNFTITNNIDTGKSIRGTLTVTTNFDDSTVGVATLNEFFEKLFSYNLDDETATFTTVKPIASWGQTDAAYTITADLFEGDDVTVYSPNSAPVLYNQNSYEWTDASVEWKPPVLGDLTAIIVDGYLSESTYIGGNYLYFSNYRGTTYYLSTESTTVKSAAFTFRITRGNKSISGTVTVNLKKVTKTPAQIQQEAEKTQLDSLRISFNSYFSPSYFSGSGGVVSRFIDKDIIAFGQTDVLYTISARGGNNYFELNPITNENDYYGYVTLPTYPSTITWETKTANAAVVLNSGTRLKVYTDKTGTAEFNFTYTYTYPGSTAKTVKGTVKVTAMK